MARVVDKERIERMIRDGKSAWHIHLCTGSDRRTITTVAIELGIIDMLKGNGKQNLRKNIRSFAKRDLKTGE